MGEKRVKSSGLKLASESMERGAAFGFGKRGALILCAWVVLALFLRARLNSSFAAPELDVEAVGETVALITAEVG